MSENVLPIQFIPFKDFVINRVVEILRIVPSKVVNKLPLYILKFIPNALTLSRPVLTVYAISLLFQGFPALACLVAIVASATDYFDGEFARLIEKKYTGYGITEFGKLWDPICDKAMVLVMALVNPYFLFVLVPEAFSAACSNHIRSEMGEHFITRGSKVATFFQFIFVLTSFFATTSPRKEIWACLVVACSCARFFSYAYAIEKAKEECPSVVPVVKAA